MVNGVTSPRWTVIQADVLEALRGMADNSFDALLSDPPAGISFMGREWDSDKGGRDQWIAWLASVMREAYRALKPGAFALVWALPRTSHWTATAIEDAGFDVRDVITHHFGCLSEDSEILLSTGWAAYSDVRVDDLALCYDTQTDGYAWGPVQEVLTYAYSDTAYRIRSDRTDQIVSRQHRCIVERDGVLAFSEAEALQREARVPVLEDVHRLLESIPVPHEGAGDSESVVLRMPRCADLQVQDRHIQNSASCVWSLRKDVPQGAWSTDVGGEVLRPALLLESTGGFSGTSGEAEGHRGDGSGRLDKRESRVVQAQDERREQSGLEGRCYVQEGQGELHRPEVCSVPIEFADDGSQGRLCDGASSRCGATDRAAVDADGVSSSRGPQHQEQRSGEPDAVRDQQGPQAVRGSRFTSTDLASVEPFRYEGTVWCVRVPTGAFVARRNGKVFPTGNSGFPKSLDISKGIDKAKGNGDDIRQVTAWIRKAARAAKKTNRDIDALFGHNGMAGHWTTQGQQAAVPTDDQWARLVEFLDVEPPAEIQELAAHVNLAKGQPGDNWFKRPIHGIEIRSNAPSGIVSIGRESTRIERKLTSSADDQSAVWEGQGTALKPATEHWILARKPLDGTYAENVQRWGVGGLAVDECRLGIDADERAIVDNRSGAGFGNVTFEHQGRPEGERFKSHSLGRWPTNLVLTHSIDCRRTGQKRDVKNGTAVKRNGVTNNDACGFGARGTYPVGTPDAGYGVRPVEIWECVHDCPVRIMDEQSGDRPGMSGGGVHRADYGGGMSGGIDSAATARNDSGGASRFFPRFQWSLEDIEAARFLYQAKASKAERDFGCDALPLRTGGEMTGREDGSAGTNSPRAGAGRNEGARNHHPTIKAVGLTKWLATLVRPPARAESPRRILVPFLGSGSEAIGALRAGWDEIIGIEREPEYVAIAKARLTRWEQVPASMDEDEVASSAEKPDERQAKLFG